MAQKIIVYGNSDKEQFPTPEGLQKYLSDGLFNQNKGRYPYSQNKDADIIVISRKSLAYGHLTVEERVQPTDQDRQLFPPTKGVYCIESSVVYGNPVKLYRDLGLKVNSFGKLISEKEFLQIQELAGSMETFRKSD